VEDGYEDEIGEYRNVVGMRIDPSKVGDAEIFRPWGWQTNIIVSERVKRAMEESGTTGARFTEV
ncbi:imm11 family protein, partial [Archangium sp.]|uniref:imm11 family protein n=1 Tax=Archangium sp. TaxID=1872627 RepID=UPI002D69921F